MALVEFLEALFFSVAIVVYQYFPNGTNSAGATNNKGCHKQPRTRCACAIILGLSNGLPTESIFTNL